MSATGRSAMIRSTRMRSLRSGWGSGSLSAVSRSPAQVPVNRERGTGKQPGMAEESDGAVIAVPLRDPGAFGVIFDRHGSTLLRFLARRVDPAEAEDLLGEGFRIAFERRSAFDRGRGSARARLV